MQRVALGRTDLEVTRLGLGLAPIAGLYSAVSEEQARATIDHAWSRGVRYFDTAPLYGYGHSERRAGRALADRPRAEFTLSTKVGRLLRAAGEDAPARGVTERSEEAPQGAPEAAQEFWSGVEQGIAPVFDFSAAGVASSLAESLDRLNLSHVDIAFIHDPDDHLPQALAEAAPTLERLRAEGRVGAIGVGANSAEVLARCIREADLDCVLLAGRYTLLDQVALDELLPLAQARGVAVIAAGVFNSGILADPRPGVTYNYEPATAEILARAQALREVCARFDVPLRTAAVQFPLRHPAVVSVLVGARSPAEVDDAVDAITAPVPAALWTALADEGFIRE
ncbi:D-threo-aldose 1-dehydrogenase [Allocatelliglobosispora scoriae]|uniref:D-threo-aldose 1-dehydrogenase n=1 Tax=Allocatelliglobosispora scoriae TaxID=643052 RepID=A0A841BS55_9ACTN|nr:aldo/keto reductase [Allocatelliglobosispora scoriae]MBB5869562.1 D-threo-aldose 1-dehydrogenase [Allocatelliglobosispora scoriae]